MEILKEETKKTDWDFCYGVSHIELLHMDIVMCSTTQKKNKKKQYTEKVPKVIPRTKASGAKNVR